LDVTGKRVTDKTPVGIGLKALENLHLEIQLLTKRISTIASNSTFFFDIELAVFYNCIFYTDECGERQKFRAKRREVKKKAHKMIDQVNRHLERKITVDDFKAGRLRWRKKFEGNFSHKIKLKN